MQRLTTLAMFLYSDPLVNYNIEVTEELNKDSTIDYYNKNSSEFISRTIDVDMTEAYDNFLKLLPDGARILDAGCGSGRDAKKFAELGFAVSAFDASEEMVKHATQYSGIEVQQLRFDQLEYKGEFDGVWTCASLLHVRKDEFVSTFQNLVNALKSSGVIYVSLKQRESNVPVGGRHFSYYSADEVDEIISDQPDLELLDLWFDENAECGWINLLARRL